MFRITERSKARYCSAVQFFYLSQDERNDESSATDKESDSSERLTDIVEAKA